MLQRSERERATVAHTVPEYLPRAATYIHGAIAHQQRYASVVIARRMANLSEFPLDAPVRTPAAGSAPKLRLRKAAAFAHRYADDYELTIERVLQQSRSTLLHAHHGWSGRASVRAAARLGLPIVTTFYGRDLSLKKGRKAIRQPYARLFEYGSAFVCEGPAMRAHLVSLGCPPERIRLVKIGIDLGRFEFRIPIRNRPLIVLQAARLVEKKGVDLALRAFAAARARLGPSELWILGDGELRGELERLASELGVGPSVRFLGERSYADYRKVLAQAHVCIQPSRTAADGDTEGGAPTVLLEMQARGIPIVATRHADIPAVVAAHEALVLEEDVPGLADALVQVAGLSEEDYRERARRGREYVEREHTVQGMAAALEAVYDSVLGPVPHRGAREPETAHA